MSDYLPSKKEHLRRASTGNAVGIVGLLAAIFTSGWLMWAFIAVAFLGFAFAVREQFRWRAAVMREMPK